MYTKIKFVHQLALNKCKKCHEIHKPSIIKKNSIWTCPPFTNNQQTNQKPHKHAIYQSNGLKTGHFQDTLLRPTCFPSIKRRKCATVNTSMNTITFICKLLRCNFEKKRITEIGNPHPSQLSARWSAQLEQFNTCLEEPRMPPSYP